MNEQNLNQKAEAPRRGRPKGAKSKSNFNPSELKKHCSLIFEKANQQEKIVQELEGKNKELLDRLKSTTEQSESISLSTEEIFSASNEITASIEELHENTEKLKESFE